MLEWCFAVGHSARVNPALSDSLRGPVRCGLKRPALAGFSWFATEPLLILVLILAPFAIGNVGKWGFCAGCAVWMQAVGMDPAFLAELIF